MNPIMAIFHRYFTRRHLHHGMKGDTNLAGRTEEDFVILCVCVGGVGGVLRLSSVGA